MYSHALTDDHTSTATPNSQVSGEAQSPTILEIAAALNNINDAPLLECLEAYRPTGRRGYGPKSMWRAYFAGFILNVASTNDLIRRLQDSAELRLMCGLHSIPSQPTFSRFIARLAKHTDLVLACIHGLTDEFRERLPGFGETIAIDSSIINAYGNPWGKPPADPDASWTAKRKKNGEIEFRYGYKLHLAVDAVHGVPIAAITTTGGRYDGHLLPPLLAQAAAALPWFKPQAVLADKGYDDIKAHEAIAKYGAAAVIPLRDLPKGAQMKGPYTNGSEWTCRGKQSMERVATDPEKGTLFACPSDGCALKSKNAGHCQYERWYNPVNLRRNPKIPLKSPEWKAIYTLRQEVERSFKSMKQSRRLAEPYLMGLAKVGLHCAMSTLATSSTTMARLQSGGVAGMRWQVRRVA